MSKIIFFRRSWSTWKFLSTICVAISIACVALFVSKSDDVPQAKSGVERPKNRGISEQSLQSQAPKTSAKTGSKPLLVDVEPTSSITDALSSLQPPARAVWTLLESYGRNSSHTLEEDLNIVSALSYCANSKDNSEFLRELRASGQALPEEAAAIESSISISQPLCVRLSDADFELRTNVMRTWAEKGNAEAMLGFFEVGPPGGWKPEARDEDNSATTLAWRSEAIAHVERAMSMGRAEAFATLAEIYRPRIEEKSIFKGIENAERSYSYGYAYAMALLSNTTNEDVSTGLQNYVKQLSNGLTEEEKREAEFAANKMLEQCCTK